MHLRTSLELRQHQTLSISPKLRQSIALLQLPSLELEQTIQLELEKNPFLELESYSSAHIISESDSVYHHNYFTTSNFNSYPNSTNSKFNGFNDKEDHYDFINQYPNYISLKQHLLAQLQLLPLSNKEKIIAYALIDDIDDNGYLQSSLLEIRNHLIKNPIENLESILFQNNVLFRNENKVPYNYHDNEFNKGSNIAVVNPAYTYIEDIKESELETVLLRLQDFDPAGVAARNLSECLTIQLASLPKSTPQLEIAKKLVLNYLELLAEKDYSTVQKILKLGHDELNQALRLLKQLDPKPGSYISAKHLDYIIPDVIVRNQNNKLMVELNMANIPKLRINQEYRNLLATRDFANKTSLKQYLSDAEWFLKSIQTRNETLLRVCHSIVTKQAQFFQYGVEQLKPLSLQEIAAASGFHESTISRITQQKTMQTPRGTFELRYFFSNPIRKREKEQYKEKDKEKESENRSSSSVRALIKKIIQEEKNPLSDQEICKILSDQGIKINRRTLAKYRIAMKIAPSHERRRSHYKTEILCNRKDDKQILKQRSAKA